MKKGADLFLIIIAAFIVRAIGINYGLPFLYHDDEPIVVNYALAYGAGDFNPHVFNIAPLLTYVLFFLYGIFFAIGHLLGYFHTLKDFAYLYLNDPASFYLIGRCVYGLLCGTASVLLLYLLGKKYFNRTTGILASIFLAFNFLHVRDSHYIYFDIPLTFCVLLFFLKAYDFFAPARKIDYIQLGALVGLAISVKYQGISLLFPFCAIILYNFAISKKISAADKVYSLVWCAAALGGVVFVSNPFLFINFSGAIRGMQRLPYMPVSWLHHLRVSLFNGCGLLICIFGIIGVIWAFVRRNRGVLVASYIVLYYLLMIRATQPGERLILPILPLLLLFAAVIAERTVNIIGSRPLSFLAKIILVIILVYPSFRNVCYSDLLLLKEDTRSEAHRWIRENIRPGTKIALDATASWFPRLERDREQIKELENYFGSTSFAKPANAERAKLKFMLDNPYYPDKTYHLFYMRGFTKRGFLSIYPCINVLYPELESKDVEYVVLSNIFTSGDYGGFVTELKKHAIPIKTFSPYKDGVSRIKSTELTPVPSGAFMEKELRERKSYGPYIKIYKMEKRI